MTNDRDIEDTRLPLEPKAFNVRCKVCEERYSNEDSILMIGEQPDPDNNVWCCKQCSSGMLKSLDKECIFCGGYPVENLFMTDGKVVPVCWSCDLDLE